MTKPSNYLTNSLDTSTFTRDGLIKSCAVIECDSAYIEAGSLGGRTVTEYTLNVTLNVTEKGL